MEPRSKNTPGLILTILVLVAVFFYSLDVLQHQNPIKLLMVELSFPTMGSR